MTRLAYLVHVYTATGVVWALLSLIAIDAFNYRLALIWLVHIGVDRLVGYGLKYPTAFKDTHLQRV